MSTLAQFRDRIVRSQTFNTGAVVLLDDVDANVVGTTIFEGRGKLASVSIIADDFDGATVELQVQRVDDPGDRWAPISAEATRTGDDLPALLKMGPILVGEHIRAVLTGPGSPSNVRVTIDDHAP